MPKENGFARNGTNTSPTATCSTTSSSRSSSRASSTPSSIKVDDKLATIIENVASEIKEEILTEVQNKVEEDLQRLLVDFRAKEEPRYKEQLIAACVDNMKRGEHKLIKNNENIKKQVIRNLKRQVKEEVDEEALKAQQNTFSAEWQDIADNYTEHLTDDIEITLWEEMTSSLQNVYRSYRNTSNTLKLDNQASVDLTYNRLESMLTTAQANHNDRVRYLTNTTQQYLRDEVKRRELDFQMKLELEARTLRRELAQIRQDAARYKETKSTTCILL